MFHGPSFRVVRGDGIFSYAGGLANPDGASTSLTRIMGVVELVLDPPGNYHARLWDCPWDSLAFAGFWF